MIAIMVIMELSGIRGERGSGPRGKGPRRQGVLICFEVTEIGEGAFSVWGARGAAMKGKRSALLRLFGWCII